MIVDSSFAPLHLLHALLAFLHDIARDSLGWVAEPPISLVSQAAHCLKIGCSPMQFLHIINIYIYIHNYWGSLRINPWIWGGTIFQADFHGVFLSGFRTLRADEVANKAATFWRFCPLKNNGAVDQAKWQFIMVNHGLSYWSLPRKKGPNQPNIWFDQRGGSIWCCQKHQESANFAMGVRKSPVWGILKITFKYLLEILSPMSFRCPIRKDIWRWGRMGGIPSFHPFFWWFSMKHNPCSYWGTLW